jgi:hypothetical protein
MRTATLIEIVENIRFEIGNGAGLTQGVASIPGTKYLAQRMQRQLYEMFDWPHLIIEQDVSLVAGTRYYDWTAPLNRDRVISIFVKWSNAWTPIKYGFDSSLYNASMPESTYQNSPVQFWRFHNDDQFEVWPNPADVHTLRVRCVRSLGAFTADSDVSDLDADLIAMFCASELSARMKSDDAEVKNAQAQSMLARIKAQMFPNKPFIYGGGPATVSTTRDYQLQGRKI